jgi:hypothetical protein
MTGYRRDSHVNGDDKFMKHECNKILMKASHSPTILMK